MRIIDLIEKLQTRYNTYTDEDKVIMGEPEIMIDVFKAEANPQGFPWDIFMYAGFGKDIVISKSDDGVYDILSAFYEDQEPKTTKLFSSPMSKP